MRATKAVTKTQALFDGRPGILAGSSIAAVANGLEDIDVHDVDIFCPSQMALAANIEYALSLGFRLEEKDARMWARWMHQGAGSFHVHSMNMQHDDGLRVNFVYKTLPSDAGHRPVTNASGVVESFDFGFLAVAYDLADATWHDFRKALFPNVKEGQPYGLTPYRRRDYMEGFFSPWLILRVAGRYLKYLERGFDMRTISQQLIEGYRKASLLYLQDPSEESKLRARVCVSIASAIELNDLGVLKIISDSETIKDLALVVAEETE